MKLQYVIMVFSFLLVFTCGAGEKPETAIIHIGEKSIEVELANTPGKRKLGFMNRTSLDDDKGILFVFDKEHHLSFWMKNTSIPLSIAYISKSGYIKEIHDLEPYSLEKVKASSPVLYALEVNRGYFEKNGIKVGDFVEIP